MKMVLNRRFFLKKLIVSTVLILYFFNKINIYTSKKNNTKNLELLKNFHFSKKKYHQQTTNFIFTNFLKEKKNEKNIMFNIEKRIKLSNFKYKENIKFLI